MAGFHGWAAPVEVMCIEHSSVLGPGLGGTILSRDTKISFFPATNSCDRGGQGFPKALKKHNLYIVSWVYPEVFFQLDMYKPTHLEGHQEAFCHLYVYSFIFSGTTSTVILHYFLAWLLFLDLSVNVPFCFI